MNIKKNDKRTQLDISHRRKAVLDKPKVVRVVSFSGDEGYKALEIYDNSKHRLGKSGLVIDLLLIYEKAFSVFGDCAIEEMEKYLDRKINRLNKQKDSNLI